MALGVLPEDKPKIAFTAAMMWVQNFGFFLMYLMMWIFMPKDDKCNSLRFWVGFFSLDCFLESFWMGMAGFTDDSTLFPVMWILHLLVALPYVLCTFTIPGAMYSDDGKACRENTSLLKPLEPVWILHASVFLVYVVMMLTVTYFSFLKPKFFRKSAQTSDSSQTSKSAKAVLVGARSTP